VGRMWGCHNTVLQDPKRRSRGAGLPRACASGSGELVTGARLRARKHCSICGSVALADSPRPSSHVGTRRHASTSCPSCPATLRHPCGSWAG
jgi:hypothetical protein